MTVFGVGPADQQFRIGPPKFPAANSTLNLDLTEGSAFRIQLPAGNITIGPVANAVPGSRLVLEFVQDGVGLRHVTFDASFFTATGAALTVAAGGIDVLFFGYNALGQWHQGAGAALNLLSGQTL